MNVTRYTLYDYVAYTHTCISRVLLRSKSYICITLPCSTLISVLPRLSNFESVDINTCLAIFLVFAMNCYVKEYSYSSFCKKAKSCDN